MYIRKAASPTPCESLWEALGLGEKVLKKPFHIAAVGSGGKTTLLYTLAREARERGLSVLLLPTTHMQLPERDGVLTGRAEDVIEKLKKDGFAVAGVPVGSSEIKKIGFPGWETYEKAGAFADLVLVEADGSRRLPLKYPNATEPVVPEDHGSHPRRHRPFRPRKRSGGILSPEGTCRGSPRQSLLAALRPVNLRASDRTPADPFSTL